MATGVTEHGKEMAKRTVAVTVPLQVPLYRIGDLLGTAFEGGSDYWCLIKKYNAPPQLDFIWDAASTTIAGVEPSVYKHIDYPLNEGGSLVIGTTEGAIETGGPTRWTLDFEACKRGLILMAQQYPHHWSDFLGENDDATTADVFLQLALFGELVFG